MEAPKPQQDPVLQRLLEQMHFESVPARVKQVCLDFVDKLAADGIQNEKGEQPSPTELAIHVTATTFTNETFLKLLNHVDSTGVAITYNPETQTITFSQRLN